MPKITGISEVKRALNKLAKGFTGENVVVGFTQNYALFVHEVPARHTTGKAGFLLDNARDLQQEMSQIVLDQVKKTGSIEKGLFLAGVRLQAAAEEDTPVDTGALKASAFTALESDLEAASIQAYAEGEQVRLIASEKRKHKAADIKARKREKAADKRQKTKQKNTRRSADRKAKRREKAANKRQRYRKKKLRQSSNRKARKRYLSANRRQKKRKQKRKGKK
jgi:hypothetical protein